MADLLIQVDGLKEAELQSLIAQALPPQNRADLNRVSHFSGQDLVELALKIQHVDLDGFALLVGYLLGRGHSLKIVFQGLEVDKLDLKSFRTLLEQLKTFIKQMKE